MRGLPPHAVLLAVFAACGAPAADTAADADTAPLRCEHPLDEFPHRSRYDDLEEAVALCNAYLGGQYVSLRSCGNGWELCCYCDEYYRRVFYYGADEVLVAVTRGTDVAEFCDGTSFGETFGDVPECAP